MCTETELQPLKENASYVTYRIDVFVDVMLSVYIGFPLYHVHDFRMII